MYSTQTAESKEEEPLHTIISNTENVQGQHGLKGLMGALLEHGQMGDKIWVLLCPD